MELLDVYPGRQVKEVVLPSVVDGTDAYAFSRVGALVGLQYTGITGLIFTKY